MVSEAPQGGQRGVFVTGTDTDVGKSVVCAWLLRRLDGCYWKPVQSGMSGETDTQAVARLSGLSRERFHPCGVELTNPLSPHESARLDGVTIHLDALRPPRSTRPLVVEGAGGIMVPLNGRDLMVDLMVRLGLPVILTARTALGTINHTLLSLAMLRGRGLAVAGVILSGAPNPANRQAISHYGHVPILAEIPLLDPLNAESLAREGLGGEGLIGRLWGAAPSDASSRTGNGKHWKHRKG